jgi:outer membrane lipoprotein-sorting protein
MIARRRLRWLTAAIVTVAIMAASAPRSMADDLASLLASIAARAVGVRTLACTVRQERYLKVLSQPVLFTGKLTVEKPDRLRLEFTAPLPSVFLLDGSHGTHCSGDGEPRRFDLGADPAMAAMGRQMTSWMAGDYAALQDRYEMATMEPGPGVVMTPRDPGVARVIARLEVLFEPETRHPRRLEIIEPGGDRTVIWFTGIVVNGDVDPRAFSECHPA